MPMLTWQIWLARPLITDHPLPWQKPQRHPTPHRVLQGMGALLTQIATPTRRPKPRGKSPGWPKGRPREPVPRYKVIKKPLERPVTTRKRGKQAVQIVPLGSTHELPGEGCLQLV